MSGSNTHPDEESGKAREYTANEIRLTSEARLEWDKVAKGFEERFKNFDTGNQKGKDNVFDEVSKRGAEWLDRELKNLAAVGNEKSNKIFIKIYEHLTGDPVLKSFQLQTLHGLTKLYIEDESFQWFINSSMPSLLCDFSPNPYSLIVKLFEPGSVGIVEDSNPEAIARYNSKENIANDTLKPTTSGFIYLTRRPWLTAYLSCLMYYRRHHSLEWVTLKAKDYHPFIEEEDNNRPPNPDLVSTLVPVSTIQPPSTSGDGWPVLNNLTPS